MGVSGKGFVFHHHLRYSLFMFNKGRNIERKNIGRALIRTTVLMRSRPFFFFFFCRLLSFTLLSTQPVFFTENTKNIL